MTLYGCPPGKCLPVWDRGGVMACHNGRSVLCAKHDYLLSTPHYLLAALCWRALTA